MRWWRLGRTAPWLLAALQVTLLPPLLVGLLAACATRPADIEGMPWTAGRLSVRVDSYQGQPARNVSAAFDLRGNGARGELRLSTPLGTLIASAVWAPGSARLTTSEGQTTFDGLDALSLQALGEVVPLAALPDWLAGRPWTQATSEARNEGFDQLGWRVNLARWAEGFVEAERSSAPVVSLRMRIER